MSKKLTGGSTDIFFLTSNIHQSRKKHIFNVQIKVDLIVLGNISFNDFLRGDRTTIIHNIASRGRNVEQLGNPVYQEEMRPCCDWEKLE